MRKLSVFESVTLDGYFTSNTGDMSWAHKFDPEWTEFTAGNASGDGAMLYGRVTYEMMKSFWPTPQAQQSMPAVAEAMTRMQKYVVSKTMKQSDWNNTHFLNGDLIADVRKLKASDGDDIVILGSGSIVSQLARAGLIDGYQFALVPVVIGAGRTLFEGAAANMPMKLVKTRSFQNGNVVLWYDPV